MKNGTRVVWEFFSDDSNVPHTAQSFQLYGEREYALGEECWLDIEHIQIKHASLDGEIKSEVYYTAIPFRGE